MGKVDYSRRSLKNQSLCNFTCGVTTSPAPAVEEVYQRRARCGICHACNITEDCNGCQNCVARQKFNDSKDPNSRRRICVMRDCLRPQLPVSANCDECGKDGWGEGPNAFQIMGSKPKSGPSSLMECIICLKIVHPLCIASEVCARSIAIVNEDLPNSWECPMCVDKSKPVRGGLKRMRSHEDKRNHSNDLDNFVSTTSNYSEMNNGIISADIKLTANMNGTTPNNILNGKSMYSPIHEMKPDISDTIVKHEISDCIVERISKKPSVDRSVSRILFTILKLFKMEDTFSMVY